MIYALFKNKSFINRDLIFKQYSNVQKQYCMTRILLLSLSFLLFGVSLVAQTSMYGKITDGETGEDLLYANLVLNKNGVFVTGASTDFEGNYSIPLDPGTYDVKVTYTGYPEKLITGVVIKAGQGTKLDIQLDEGINLDEVVVVGYKVPLIEQDNTSTGGTITSEQIRNLPTKNISALAATTAGLSQVDEGDAVTIKGSRPDATDYYIDGIRVSGNLIPQSEIEQLQVITGGIQAQYGDVTGGIISITTKGPSGKFSGGAEIETSEYLDDYGYRLASLNLSGPILKKKGDEGKRDGESIIGFRFSGQYLRRLDDDPAATDIYVLKESALANLSENPVTAIGGSKVPTAEFLTQDDILTQGFKPNEESTRYDFTAKLDARLSKSIDITFTGSYNKTENQFTPGGWRLMNTQNNPTDFNTRYRGNFRFRHRLGGNAVAVEDDGAAKKGSLIRNAQYTLQMGYEKRTGELSNPTHGTNYFDYGYIGSFDREWLPTTWNMSDWSGALRGNPLQDQGIAQSDYGPQFTGYTPGTVNPGLTAYNNVVDVEDENDFVVINGQWNESTTQSIWTGMWANVNQQYNFARKIDQDLYTFNANSSFDFLPGGSEKGRHSIQFGIIYEQRFNSTHQLAPFGLWQVARQQVNRQILGIDTTNIIGSYEVTEGPLRNAVFALTGGFEIPLFGTFVDANSVSGNSFWRNVRDVTGQSINDFVNIDALDPSQLSLGMFSAQELNDANSLVGLSYFGYDYLGQKLGNDVTFEDFFSARNEEGIRTFPVAVNQPIYAAAYIQDKFTFKDIIFRVGVRVDRYDANTKVLKDPLSLYEIQTASEFHGGNLPNGVGEDYLVYTESATSNSVKAYRQGEDWFFADGSPANDGNVIFGTGVVFPKFTQTNPNIKDEGFDINSSFEDYEPQINWMPRLAFSFPISDAANFFAHYDILVQRPPSGSLATALDYFYFPERPDVNNPNLRPERTIDYEVGFQQKLSNSSAIKIAAYYKEMRDMIQARAYLYVPLVNQYQTTDNQDFGTVKGFTFQYDLRRTNNIMVTANYTLQFADGTGSSATSGRGLLSRGNLRTLTPLSFDERHRIVTTIDYRYGSGKLYNGPQLFGKNIFANAGLNLQTVAVSGRPYTATTLPLQFGGAGRQGQLNGARLPWNFTLNLRVDKSFNLAKPESTRRLGLNVYLRVQNLLDQRNVLGVYSATGSVTSDGFLNSSNGQETLDQLISQGRSIESFLLSYQARELNPDLFSLPRRIYVGAEFTF